jgi:hypothetical protein
MIGCGKMTSSTPQEDRLGSEQAVADVLRQLLAEERRRSDQLLEAMTAWQMRARLAEERLLALSGAAPPPAQAPRVGSSSGRAAPAADRPPASPQSIAPPDPDSDRAGSDLPPPKGDPVFARHPLYRGRRYRQLVEDFANEASGAQRQYAVLSAKPERVRRDEIALGLLDAEWAAIGGTDWPSADPHRLAERRARYEYRFETGRRRSAESGLLRLLLIAVLAVALVAVAVSLVVGLI